MAKLNRNYVEGSIRGRFINILVDTGASVSCVTWPMLKSIGFKEKDLTETPTIQRVRGVGGEIQEVIGAVDLIISISGFKIQQKFHVFRHLFTPMILGFDFLTDYNAMIHVGKGVLIIDDGLAAVSLVEKSKTFAKSAKTVKGVMIPPRSQCNIPLRVGRCRSGTNYLMEPISSLDTKHNLVGTKCLVKAMGDRVNYLLMNPTNATVWINKGTVIATATAVGSNEITELDNEKGNTANVYSVGTETEYKDEEYIKIAADLGVSLEGSELTTEQQRRLMILLGQYRKVFAKDMSELGHTSVYKHKIDTGDARPIRQRFYRHSAEAQKEAEKQIKEMLENGIIEKSTSEWHFPVVMVKKKDGSLRFCIDYRKLNAVTKPISFPLPRMEDVFDTIGAERPTWFSTLDLISGFWQVELDEKSRDKSAFITPQGIYRWTKMPFGLCNASATFQMVMSEVLRGLNWKFSLVYIDDVIIFSSTFEDHYNHLKQVFDKLREANLTMKASKCKFFTRSVDYLGHVISKHGIQVDPVKTKVIREFPTPKHAKDVRSFLGMCNYFRRFIKSYAEIALPLNQLLKKDAKFVWTEGCEMAFNTLKERLISPPVLAYASSNSKYQISCDASTYALGYALEKLDANGKPRAIAYGGRALRGAELNWNISELECLAVVEAIKKFHPYLANGHFHIYTDHIALKWLQNTKDMTGRLARWSLMLQGYSFTINHRSGKSNTLADGLSRRHYEGEENETRVDIEELWPAVLSATSDESMMLECKFEYKNNADTCNKESNILHAVDAEEIDEEPIVTDIDQSNDLKAMQEKCPDCGPMIQYLKEGELPANTKVARKVTIEADNYTLLDGVLYHLYYRRAKGLPKADRLVKQLVVPEPLRHEALQAYHDSLMGGGHQGKERTYTALRNKYYWVHMYRDVEQHTRSCIECQASKNRPTVTKAPLKPLPITDIWSRIHFDFIGPVTCSDDNFKHILMVTDSFTKWCEAIPTKTQEAREVAQVLYRDIFTRYGAPDTLVSDRGKCFMAGLVKALCSLFDVKRVMTSSYHPQSNAVERHNSTVGQAIRCYGQLDQKDWPMLLPGIMMAYRATPCTQSTQYSPYFLLFGREMNLPFDLNWIPKENLGKTPQAHLQKILGNLENAREIARENMEKAQEKYKKYYDVRVKEPKFEPGDKVWLFNPKVPVGLSNKFHRKWTGPYYITQKGPNYTFKLRSCADNKEMKSLIHANRMKIYYDPDSRPVQPPQQRAEAEDSHDNDDDAQLQVDDNETANARPQNTDPIPNREEAKWHEIDRILACKRQKDGIHYRVKWKGHSNTTWVHSANVSDCAKQEFHIKKTASGRRRKRPLNKHAFFDRA